jgi:hypothetical protein
MAALHVKRLESKDLHVKRLESKESLQKELNMLNVRLARSYATEGYISM